jgi:hypothetical protein
MICGLGFAQSAMAQTTSGPAPASIATGDAVAPAATASPSATASPAATTAPAAIASTQPTIALSTDIEDGKKMLQATVTLNGKPLENVALLYFVKRTFGNLPIGADTTLDDGTSAVSFPVELVGGPDGNLRIIVKIKSPDQYASVSATATYPAAVHVAAGENAFPRALWAPDAPLPLMFSIFGIVGAVWLSYAFVVSRILAIRKG